MIRNLAHVRKKCSICFGKWCSLLLSDSLLYTSLRLFILSYHEEWRNAGKHRVKRFEHFVTRDEIGSVHVSSPILLSFFISLTLACNVGWLNTAGNSWKERPRTERAYRV